MIRLKELRTHSNLSQQKMADVLGISRSAVAMWETGGSEPDNRTLEKIADYFNVSIDYLLGRNVSSSPAGVVMGYGGDEQKVIRYETEEERIVAEAAIEAYRKAKLSEE